MNFNMCDTPSDRSKVNLYGSDFGNNNSLKLWHVEHVVMLHWCMRDSIRVVL